jgi:hypothetical protein
VDGAAAALLLHMQHEGTWDSRISKQHHTDSLGVALNQWARLALQPLAWSRRACWTAAECAGAGTATS